MKDLEDLRRAIADFADERDWDQFHSPKNLASALSVECAELLEHFQWLSEADSYHLAENTHDQVAQEIADVQVYLVRLADKLGIDILSAVESKMAINAEKYPPELVKGRADKYSSYRASSEGDDAKKQRQRQQQQQQQQQ